MGKELFIVFFTLLAFAPCMVHPASAVNLKDRSLIAETEHLAKELAEKAAMGPARNLSGGGCAPTNPIDNCWRCKPDWADNRQALADCCLGYGKGTTGGKGGEIYVVKDPSDDDPANPKEGTLRWGVTRDKPVWVTFGQDMTINLKQELVINSDKTIDGRGYKIEFAGGAGLSIYQVKNVIVESIGIHDIQIAAGGNIMSSEGKAGPRAKSDGDGINIVGSKNIWIDHCSLSKGPDGLIDVTLGSSQVTISNCRFFEHDKVMLLGADDTHAEDEAMRVTVAYNKFDTGCGQRMPRCRWGTFQVVNNDYNKWLQYAIVGSSKPTILCMGNRFTAPDDPTKKEVTRRDTPEGEWKSWNWRSKDDLLLNGAVFVDSGADVPPPPEMIPPEPADSMDKLVANAGILTCTAGTPC